ncbi:MAG: SDR family oxidoreductase [Pseudomonadota bacterium]
MDDKLEDRTVVVTGGSTGIGRQTCQRLIRDGFYVVNVSLEPSSVEDARLTDYIVDLSDNDATARVAKEIASAHRVSALVHNAGVIRPSLLESVELDDLDYLKNLHLSAPILLTQAFLPAMKSQGYGRIVLISSRAALGLETRTCYSATKSAMLGMVRTWALELGQHGITVNSVAPGPIASTEMFHDVVPKGSPQMEKMAAGVPVKRLGQPEDVANAVAFFVSAESSFVTGQNLLVCGGTSLGSLPQ